MRFQRESFCGEGWLRQLPVILLMKYDFVINSNIRIVIQISPFVGGKLETNFFFNMLEISFQSCVKMNYCCCILV